MVHSNIIELEGYVIVPPLSPWDKSYKDIILADMSYPSFAKTPTEAWKRHIHPSQYEHIDFGTIVQRWHDRGYRVKKAKLQISVDI